MGKPTKSARDQIIIAPTVPVKNLYQIVIAEMQNREQLFGIKSINSINTELELIAVNSESKRFRIGIKSINYINTELELIAVNSESKRFNKNKWKLF